MLLAVAAASFKVAKSVKPCSAPGAAIEDPAEDRPGRSVASNDPPIAAVLCTLTAIAPTCRSFVLSVAEPPVDVQYLVDSGSSGASSSKTALPGFLTTDSIFLLGARLEMFMMCVLLHLISSMIKTYAKKLASSCHAQPFQQWSRAPAWSPLRPHAPC